MCSESYTLIYNVHCYYKITNVSSVANPPTINYFVLFCTIANQWYFSNTESRKTLRCVLNKGSNTLIYNVYCFNKITNVASVANHVDEKLIRFILYYRKSQLLQQ